MRRRLRSVRRMVDIVTVQLEEEQMRNPSAESRREVEAN